MSDVQTRSNSLFVATRWIVALFALGMVIMALLAGNGVWGGNRTLITGHQHLGNLLFGVAVLQLVLNYILFSRKQIPMYTMGASFLALILAFIQIGLGYAGRTNVDLRGWHMTNGVLLTAVLGMLVMAYWQSRPARVD